MRYMVEQGQTTGSRQKIVRSGRSSASRFTRLISVPIASTSPGFAASTCLRMYSVEPAPSAASTTAAGHSGCTITRTPGCAARACSIWATVKRLCTEQNPFHKMTRASRNASAELPPSGRCGRHSGISASLTPIAFAVLRPRCWSGKNTTRWPRANAHSSTVRAFEEVHTMPPLRPQNALIAAEEFM